MSSSGKTICLAPLVMVAAVLLLCKTTAAKNLFVGNQAGWTNYDLGSYRVPNYGAWATSQRAVVGDTVVFRYARGKHNVNLLPNRAAFLSCDFSHARLLDNGASGTYIWRATSPGVYYFGCNKQVEAEGNHCGSGQKFSLVVRAAAGSKEVGAGEDEFGVVEAEVLAPAPSAVTPASATPSVRLPPTPAKSPAASPPTVGPAPVSPPISPIATPGSPPSTTPTSSPVASAPSPPPASVPPAVTPSAIAPSTPPPSSPPASSPPTIPSPAPVTSSPPPVSSPPATLSPGPTTTSPPSSSPAPTSVTPPSTPSPSPLSSPVSSPSLSSPPSPPLASATSPPGAPRPSPSGSSNSVSPFSAAILWGYLIAVAAMAVMNH